MCVWGEARVKRGREGREGGIEGIEQSVSRRDSEIEKNRTEG